MSADQSTLIEAIRNEGQRKMEDILRAAEEQAKDLMTQVHSKTAESEKNALAQLERELARYRLKEQNRIFFETRRMTALVQERVLGEVIEWARDRLPSLRETSDYPRRFSALWHEALAGIVKEWMNRKSPAQELIRHILRVHPSDVSLMKKILGPDERWEVIADETISGGLELEIANGVVRISNTLESRLERGWPELLPEIRKILCEQA